MTFTEEQWRMNIDTLREEVDCLNRIVYADLYGSNHQTRVTVLDHTDAMRSAIFKINDFINNISAAHGAQQSVEVQLGDADFLFLTPNEPPAPADDAYMIGKLQERDLKPADEAVGTDALEIQEDSQNKEVMVIGPLEPSNPLSIHYQLADSIPYGVFELGQTLQCRVMSVNTGYLAVLPSTLTHKFCEMEKRVDEYGECLANHTIIIRPDLVPIGGLYLVENRRVGLQTSLCKSSCTQYVWKRAVHVAWKHTKHTNLPIFETIDFGNRITADPKVIPIEDEQIAGIQVNTLKVRIVDPPHQGPPIKRKKLVQNTAVKLCLTEWIHDEQIWEAYIVPN